jgi:hypothetical protein
MDLGSNVASILGRGIQVRYVSRRLNGQYGPAKFSAGVSGPFWYASGATVQIFLFATLAIELKRRAPNAHVSLFEFRCYCNRMY